MKYDEFDTFAFWFSKGKDTHAKTLHMEKFYGFIIDSLPDRTKMRLLKKFFRPDKKLFDENMRMHEFWRGK